MEGRDVLGLAQTGTGKTAAFALPILARLMGGGAPGPRALIVAPTRELAAQIHAELTLLGKYTRVTSTTVFGGVPQRSQERALRRNPDVVVACPGRLLDLVSQGFVRLDRVEVLVLDEADHMFDMGFLPSVRKIVAQLPKRRQNLLFSATMPPELRKLADGILNRPKVVELSHSKPAETIDHALYPVDEKKKVGLLEQLLDQTPDGNAIVFTRTKHRAKRIARQLDERDFFAIALQGNMSQGQRERAMAGFRNGDYDILVATDIAARGIDVNNVSLVINFDTPNIPDAYTHRIGRTGRSERSGRACTFVTVDDTDSIRAIEKRLGESIEVIRVPGFGGDFSLDEAPPPKAKKPQRAGRPSGNRGRGSNRARNNGSSGGSASGGGSGRSSGTSRSGSARSGGSGRSRSGRSSSGSNSPGRSSPGSSSSGRSSSGRSSSSRSSSRSSRGRGRSRGR